MVAKTFQNPGQNPEDDSSLDPTGNEKPLEFYMAQQQLYDDLLDTVRTLPPVEALSEFEATFFGHSASLDADVSPFLYKVLSADDEPEFRNTLKRACYIYVNNWDLSRHSGMMQMLIDLFQQPSLHKPTRSPSLKRLRKWLLDFAQSSDFEDLQLFALAPPIPAVGAAATLPTSSPLRPSTKPTR